MPTGRCHVHVSSSVIEAFQHDHEYEAILANGEEIVENDTYAVEEDGEFRTLECGVVPVLV